MYVVTLVVEFDIAVPKKLDNLNKVCLNETRSEVPMGKQLADAYHKLNSTQRFSV
jgi:hypothetical protein